MTWRVIFEAPAQAEIAEAFHWYEQRSYGLGGDFLRVVAAAEEQLIRNRKPLLRRGVAFAEFSCGGFPTACISSC